MKSLSLARPLVLIMIGVPGAGKSFIARQFAETFSVPLVSQDAIRMLVFVEPQHSHEEDELVQSLADAQVVELLKTQKTFIVDGGMNARVDRIALGKRAKQYGYDSLTVWVQTDEPTSRTRATKRNPRRQGDTYNSSLTDEQFNNLSKHLTAPGPQEPFVVVSGKHTFATQAKVILKKLIVPREELVQKTSSQIASSHEQPQAPQRRNVIIN